MNPLAVFLRPAARRSPPAFTERRHGSPLHRGLLWLGNPGISPAFDVMVHREDPGKVSLLVPAAPPTNWLMTLEWVTAAIG
jgi:hypothetical protein